MTSSLAPSTETMRAVVKTGAGPENVSYSVVPVPTVPATFARLEVIGAGVCGTDVHIAHDEYACEPPVIMGHEIVGIVVEVGTAFDDHWLGRRVVCETYFSTCEECAMCRDGRRNLCQKRRSVGSYENGGFAESIVLPLRNLHPIPDWLGEFDGVLCEPLACVTQCLMDPPVVNAGDTVLVTGPGTMGQLSAQVARAMGGQVTVAGLPRDAERLVFARQSGFEISDADMVLEGMFDVVIECSGSAGGATIALQAARRGGRYVQVGIFGRPVPLPLDLVLYKELTLSSGFASTAASWRRAMALIEMRLVHLNDLVTNVVPLADISNALRSVEAGEGLKTVVSPSSGPN